MEKSPKDIFQFDESKLKKVKIDEVRPNSWNPKKKDNPEYERVKKSVQINGLTQPIFVRENDNGQTRYEILDGEHRHRAAKELGIGEIYIYDEGQVDDELAKSLTLWHEVSVSMDETMLKPLVVELNSLDIDIPFTEIALEVKDNEYDTNEDDFDIDSALDDKQEPFTKPGDIIHLGNHRLMCGDSTKQDDVDRLMDGEKADLLITDPPYNVDYTGKSKDALKIQNDSMGDDQFHKFIVDSFTNAYNVLKDGAAFYCWYASKEVVNFHSGIEEAGFTVKQELVWNKNSLVMGRQDYQWKHEPCLYGWKDTGTHNWYSDRKQTTVIDWDRPSKADIHPTMKPVGLFDYQIKNSSNVNDIVLDLFSGSGTTIMACEQNGRNGYGMEYDPKYCDAIVKRWQSLTGGGVMVERGGATIPFEG